MQNSTRPTRSTRYKTRPLEENELSDCSNHHLTSSKLTQEPLKTEETPFKKEKTTDYIPVAPKEKQNDTHTTIIPTEDNVSVVTPVKIEVDTPSKEDESCVTPEKLKWAEEVQKEFKFEENNTQISTSESSVQNDDSQIEENNKEEISSQNDLMSPTRQEPAMGLSSTTVNNVDLHSFIKIMHQKDTHTDQKPLETSEQKLKKQKLAQAQINGKEFSNDTPQDTEAAEPTDTNQPSSQNIMTTDKYFEAASYHLKLVTKSTTHSQSQRADSTREATHTSKPGPTTSRSSGRRRKPKVNPNNFGTNQLEMKTNASSTNNSVAPSNQNTSRGKGRRRSPEKEPMARINIGEKFQATSYPIFFLETLAREHKIIYGTTYEAPKLVYSPDLLEQYKCQRLDKGEATKCIKNDFDMNTYIKKCAEIWKLNWHPFSPEFAFKLLHKAHYDPELAISILSNPQFDFKAVCDPPLIQYRNKWSPSDKRGHYPTCPYPPAKFTRGYYIQRMTAKENGSL